MRSQKQRRRVPYKQAPKRGKRCRSTDKVTFDTRELAEREMNYRQALHGGTNRKLATRAYKCDSSNCKGWHLTSMSNAQYDRVVERTDV